MPTRFRRRTPGRPRNAFLIRKLWMRQRHKTGVLAVILLVVFLWICSVFWASSEEPDEPLKTPEPAKRPPRQSTGAQLRKPPPPKNGKGAKLRDAQPVFRHPIPDLITDAEDSYNRKLSEQSRTLPQAVSEYRRRYGRPPPKGFDEWFQYAKEHHVKMIDDYDGMIRDLRPFWALSPKELRKRAHLTPSIPKSSIAVVQVESGIAYVWRPKPDTEVSDESKARAEGFIQLIQPFVSKLPSMAFPINGLDEARVLIPWDYQHSDESEDETSELSSLIGQPYFPTWSRGNVWDAYRDSCHPDSNARRMPFLGHVSPGTLSYPPNPPNSILITDEQFRFSPDVDIKFDWCKDPWAHVMSTTFFSKYRTLPALFPIFSYGKSSKFADIRIPNLNYFSGSPNTTYGLEVSEATRDHDVQDVPWSEKTPNIYWRGEAEAENWEGEFTVSFQRQRFVRMLNDRSETKRYVIYRNPQNSAYQNRTATMNDLNSVSDVFFSLSVNIMDLISAHPYIPTELPIMEATTLGEAWKHKYVMVLDGWGPSKEFFAHLESDSVPMKSTILKEYYSDWIQPWVHYIPISQSFGELYNVHAFFSGPTPATLQAPITKTLHEGDDSLQNPFTSADKDLLLQRIANAGRAWKRTHGRIEDARAYAYRLCLEWARLWADNRDSMDYRAPPLRFQGRQGRKAN